MGKWLYKRIKYIFSALIEIIYGSENRCIICNLDIENEISICKNCDTHLPYLNNKILNYENTCLSKVYSIFRFEGKIKEFIYNLKYNKDRDKAILIGNIMSKFIIESKLKIDIIIPIPMHRDRLKEKGYNHTYLIAKRISDITGIKIEDSLKKEKITSSQVLLSGTERWYNVKGSFKSIKKYKNKSILLIDDVVTTGATAHFCALELGDDNIISLLSFASSKKF